MSSKIFNALLDEKIENLIASFKSTSRAIFFDEKIKRIIHSGEFGVYREKIFKDFLRFIIPQKLGINDGFIITSNDDVSTQCDIIIYDKNITPLIQSNELQTFYPVETVVGIGEVKSKMSKNEFIVAINKLARIKKMRESVPNPYLFYDPKREGEFKPEFVPFDNVFSFIICEKFNFDFKDIEKEINQMYDAEITYHNRHNVILSIDDGLLAYTPSSIKDDYIYTNPILKDKNLNKFIPSNKLNEYHHFRIFALGLYQGISTTSILYPELTNYLKGIEAVDKI